MLVGALGAHTPEQQIVDTDAGRCMEHTRTEDMVPDPIVIGRCRELLGEEADGLSDDDVDRIRRHAEAMARVIVEIFLEQRAAQE
jgi:hypothetical protein